MSREIVGMDGMGAQTAPAAGTPFTIPLPAKRGAKTVIDSVVYTPGATSHTLTVMRVLGRTTVASAGATGQAVLNLTANPGPSGNALAANDYVVVRKASTGVFYVLKVSSVATLAFTMTANLPMAFAAGDLVYMFGIVTDTDPVTGTTFPTYPLATGAQRTVTNTNGNGLVGANNMGDPVLLYVDNITNAGAFNQATWLYTYEPGSPRGLLGDEESGESEGGDGTTEQGALGDRLGRLPWGKIGELFGSILMGWLSKLGSGGGQGGGQTPPPNVPPTFPPIPPRP